MYHDKKRVYDFFKYYFNKIFRSLLESDTSVDSRVFLEYCRGEMCIRDRIRAFGERWEMTGLACTLVRLLTIMVGIGG